MYADHSLRLAQEIVTKNFLLRLLRLGKLDKLLVHQIVKENFPFPPPAQL